MKTDYYIMVGSWLDVLGHFATFWDVLGCFGMFWDILEDFGTFWDVLGHGPGLGWARRHYFQSVLCIY